MERSGKIEHLVQRYGTREELIKRGVWRGELYRAEEATFLDRGWCWKTLLLDREDELLVTELVPVPTNFEDTGCNYAEAGRLGVRKLTTELVQDHPLMEEDDRLKESISVEETLDIVRLDISRLLLDPVFSDPECKAEMVQILYNYVAHNHTSYKQGYHELCGAVYLQMLEEEGETRKLNTLNIFNKLMAQVRPVFYEETALLQFSKQKFDAVFKLTAPMLRHLLTAHHGLDHAVWLIRWTRLLFLREFDIAYVLRIWDHLLTFTVPVQDLVACCTVVLLIAVTQDLYACEDQGEVISILLHYPQDKLINCVDLMKHSASLYELYVTRQYSDMRGLGENLCKVYNRSWYEKQTQVADHNRLRLEERLKRRVEQRLRK
ncbi:Rab-GAP TBC domain-containing protein [Lachancea thermotolerans]